MKLAAGSENKKTSDNEARKIGQEKNNVTYGTKYSRMNQMKLVEDSLQKFWSDYGLLKQTVSLKFFKGCLSQISLGPFLNTLSYISFIYVCMFCEIKNLIIENIKNKPFISSN